MEEVMPRNAEVEKILSTDILKFKFDEDPIKNSSCQALFYMYRVALKTTGDVNTSIDITEQMRDRYIIASPENTFIKDDGQWKPDIREMVEIIQNPENHRDKLASEAEYNESRAMQLGIAGRTAYKLKAAFYRKIYGDSTLEPDAEKKMNDDGCVSGFSRLKVPCTNWSLAKGTRISARFVHLAGILASAHLIPAGAATAGLLTAIGVGVTTLSNDAAELGDSKQLERDLTTLFGAAYITNQAAIKKGDQNMQDDSLKIMDTIFAAAYDPAFEYRKNGRPVHKAETADFAIGTGCAIASVASSAPVVQTATSATAFMSSVLKAIGYHYMHNEIVKSGKDFKGEMAVAIGNLANELGMDDLDPKITKWLKEHYTNNYERQEKTARPVMTAPEFTIAVMHQQPGKSKGNADTAMLELPGIDMFKTTAVQPVRAAAHQL